MILNKQPKTVIKVEVGIVNKHQIQAVEVAQTERKNAKSKNNLGGKDTLSKEETKGKFIISIFSFW